MSTKLRVTHHFTADVETVFALMSDPAALERKYEACGATDIKVSSVEDRDGAPRIVTRRKVTVDLPGFAKKVMQPTNTVVQTDDWSAPAPGGTRVCTYTVEVQGVPSRIDGTVTLAADGDGTKQSVQADVKVSIPLLGGKLERFAVESGEKQLQDEADFTAGELVG
jgi:hypothetical protein